MDIANSVPPRAKLNCKRLTLVIAHGGRGSERGIINAAPADSHETVVLKTVGDVTEITELSLKSGKFMVHAASFLEHEKVRGLSQQQSDNLARVGRKGAHIPANGSEVFARVSHWRALRAGVGGFPNTEASQGAEGPVHPLPSFAPTRLL